MIRIAEGGSWIDKQYEVRYTMCRADFFFHILFLRYTLRNVQTTKNLDEFNKRTTLKEPSVVSIASWCVSPTCVENPVKRERESEWDRATQTEKQKYSISNSRRRKTMKLMIFHLPIYLWEFCVCSIYRVSPTNCPVRPLGILSYHPFSHYLLPLHPQQIHRGNKIKYSTNLLIHNV